MAIKAMSNEEVNDFTKKDPTAHMIDLCAKRNAITEKIKELGETKKAYDEAIKNTLKAPQKSTFGEYHVSWVETVTRRVDTKKLKQIYPEVAEECTSQTTADRLTITVKKID